jgi:hypothetical protein
VDLRGDAVTDTTHPHRYLSNSYVRSMPPPFRLFTQAEMVARIEAVRAEDARRKRRRGVMARPQMVAPPRWACPYCGDRFQSEDDAQRHCSDTCAEASARVTLIRRSTGQRMKRRMA